MASASNKWLKSHRVIIVSYRFQPLYTVELNLLFMAGAQIYLPNMLKKLKFLIAICITFLLLSPFSGSADTLLKKNAEPILHIAGLDITIVKVQCT